MTGFSKSRSASGRRSSATCTSTERSRGGEFTADDEQLAIALAAAAYAAIANARRFAESEQPPPLAGRLRRADTLLLSGAAVQPPRWITRLAAAAADADFAALAAPHGATRSIVGRRHRRARRRDDEPDRGAGGLTGRARRSAPASPAWSPETAARRPPLCRAPVPAPLIVVAAGSRRAGPRRAAAGPGGRTPGYTGTDLGSTAAAFR